MASKMSRYVKPAKKTPVFLLLDVSGSMYGEKIDTLNDAVDTLLKTLAADEAEYLVAVITFGNSIECFIEPMSAKDANRQWRNMDAHGMTPLGGALRMAKDMIDDDSIIGGRMYYPIVVLVSDGEPNDEWQAPLDNFITTGRTAKCQRMAMGIGTHANMNVLKKFVRGMTNDAIYQAHDAADIKDFFEKVSRVSQEQSQGRPSIKAATDEDAKDGTATRSQDDLHGDLPPTNIVDNGM